MFAARPTAVAATNLMRLSNRKRTLKAKSSPVLERAPQKIAIKSPKTVPILIKARREDQVMVQ